eukprot:jgi/Mesvir1/722/Mv17329-RA.1
MASLPVDPSGFVLGARPAQDIAPRLAKPLGAGQTEARLPVSQELPQNEANPRPCPCAIAHAAALIRGETSRAGHGPAGKGPSALESSYLADNVSLDSIFRPGLFQGGSICKEVLQHFPYTWNDAANVTGAHPAEEGQALARAINAQCQHTCAVVGSGRRLKGARHGPEIDAADVVIRMNAAPVQGYEADVGRRTSLRLVFPKSLLSYHNAVQRGKGGGEGEPPPDLYVMRCEPWCVPMLQYLSKGLPVPTKVLLRNHIRNNYTADVTDRLVMATMATFDLARAFTAKKPTTGSLAVSLALLVCERVALYGFGQPGEVLYGYYYERGYPGVKGAEVAADTNNLLAAGAKKHDFSGEWQAWKRLQDAGLLVSVP